MTNLAMDTINHQDGDEVAQQGHQQTVLPPERFAMRPAAQNNGWLAL
jgi:hypothetical protein